MGEIGWYLLTLIIGQSVLRSHYEINDQITSFSGIFPGRLSLIDFSGGMFCIIIILNILIFLY